nr:hypothetical protein Iba_chr15aCG4410 [Ipomoea batatas]GME00250.1 hypothetical protein Iba_chr15fCG3590 [Ipomoea batatas]
MVHKYAHELFTNTCKWTGITLYVKKSQNGQYKRPDINVGSRSRFNLAAISFPLSPCKLALKEKKVPVIHGPKTSCPITNFFKVVATSRLGNFLPKKLNQAC